MNNQTPKKLHPHGLTLTEKIVGIIVGAIVLYALIMMVVGWDAFHGLRRKSSTPISDSREISQRSKPQHLPDVGDIVSLAESNLCSDRATNTRLAQLAVARDYVGINLLVMTGKVIQISEGTRAKIINQSLFTTEVRIMSGPHAGRSGFIAN